MKPDLIPNYWAPRFEDIDFSFVLNEKRRYLCVDLDNTLLPQKGHQVTDSVLQCLESLRQQQAFEDICLISNVMLPGHRVSRLYRLAEVMAIKHVVPCYFWNRKPGFQPFSKALSLLKAKPEETVMVGDQIFSDIVGGNRSGLFTVWLDPISSDHWSTLITGRRRREQVLKQELAKIGVPGFTT